MSGKKNGTNHTSLSPEGARKTQVMVARPSFVWLSTESLALHIADLVIAGSKLA